MIRRQVEYVIGCDAERVLGAECRFSVGWHAFGDTTSKACEVTAADAGWFRVSPRYWLCPNCKHKHPDYRRLAENLNKLAAAVGAELEPTRQE